MEKWLSYLKNVIKKINLMKIVPRVVNTINKKIQKDTT